MGAADGYAADHHRLGEGGTVTQPLEKQMWGDLYGSCTDQFAIPWMADIAVARA